MTAHREDISGWFDRGVEDGQMYLIVVCDTFEHDDYPVYVKNGDDFYDTYDKYCGNNMQMIMEVYHLGLDKDQQMNERRARHEPSRT